MEMCDDRALYLFTNIYCQVYQIQGMDMYDAIALPFEQMPGDPVNLFIVSVYPELLRDYFVELLG